MTTGTLDISILSAEQLKTPGLFETRSTYVICQVGDQKEQSSTSTTKCPTWSDTFRFFITTERTAFITIKRKTFIFADNAVGNVEVDLDKVLTHGKDIQTVPVVTSVGDQCCSQIMTEKGILKLSLSFVNWQKSSPK